MTYDPIAQIRSGAFYAEQQALFEKIEFMIRLSNDKKSVLAARIPEFGKPVSEQDVEDPQKLPLVKAAVCVQYYIAAEHFAIAVGFNASSGFGAPALSIARVLVEQMFQFHHLFEGPVSRFKDFLDFQRIEELKLRQLKDRYPGQQPYCDIVLPSRAELEEWWEANRRRWFKRIGKKRADRFPDSWPTISTFQIAEDSQLRFEYDLSYGHASAYVHPSPRGYAGFRKVGGAPGTVDITSTPSPKNIDAALLLALRGYGLFLLRFGKEFNILDLDEEQELHRIIEGTL